MKFDWVLSTPWVLNCFEIDLVNWIISKRKVKRDFGTSNWWTHLIPKTCFEVPLGGVLIRSWGRPKSTSQGRSLNVRLGCPPGVISGSLQYIRWGRPQNGQIESSGDVLETLEGDVLGTPWGPIFVSWDQAFVIV